MKLFISDRAGLTISQMNVVYRNPTQIDCPCHDRKISKISLRFQATLTYRKISASEFAFRSASSTMKLTRALRHYTKWFHIFGQSCYPPFGGDLTMNGPRRRVHKSLNYFPCVMNILLTILLTAIKYISTFSAESFTTTGSVIVFIGLLSYVSTVFISVGQSLFHSSYFALLFTQISAIEQTSRKNYSFDFQSFHRNYFRQSYVILISSVLPSFITYYLGSSASVTYLLVVMFSFALKFMTLIPIYHALFYIHLLDQMLKSFAKYVDVQATTAVLEIATNPRRCQAKYLKSELNYYKLLHFKLWEAGQSINNIFGWTLTTVLMQHFVHSLFNVYFTLIEVSEKADIHGVLRKCYLRPHFSTLCPVRLINRSVMIVG